MDSFLAAVVYTRRIDKNTLVVVAGFYAQYLVAGSLRSMRCNAQLLAYQRIHQGRLAGIRLADQGNVSAQKFVIHSSQSLSDLGNRSEGKAF